MFRLPPALGGPLGRLRSALADAIDGALFPSNCPICSVPTFGPPFCADCRAELIEATGRPCPRCAMPVGPYADLDRGCSECRGVSLGFDAAIALGPYQGPIRELCLRMKREPEAWLIKWVAKIWVEGRAEALRSAVDWEADPPPLVVPVPQHWTKGLGRSFYNQADVLAEELARNLGLRIARPLRRVRATPKLARLSRSRRFSVLRGAFAAAPGRVRGRRIVLVDDILTSGATCGAAARALKKAGAGRVVVAVVGRAEGQV